MRLVAALLICALVLAAEPAGADAPDAAMSAEARAYLEQGMRHYDVQEYERAIEAFKAGYLVEPRSEFLYALGQAHRLGGNCQAAIDAYRSFLRATPPEEQAERARAHVAACEAKLSEEVAAAPPPPATPPPPAPLPNPPPAEAEPNPPPVAAPPAVEQPPRWYDDAPGWLLTAGGLGSAVAGVVLLSVANGRAGEANDAAQYDAYQAAAGEAAGLRLAGGITIALGTALTAGGVVRFAGVATE